MGKFVCTIPACATALPSSIDILDGNAQPDILTFTVSGSQLVALDPGTYTILVFSEVGTEGFSGDCVEHSNLDASVTIKAGQHLTCTIIAAP